MRTSARRPASSAAVLLTAFAVPLAAQQGPPAPAPELQKLAPLLGNWHGTGTANLAAATPTKWSARGTYRWCLDGHFLQEDFELSFEGRPVPLVFRAWLGWDRENRRYVNALANSSGEVALHPMTLQPDGTMVMLMLQAENGVPYAERSLFKVEGDKLVHSIDLLLPQGASKSVVDGFFTRGGDGFDGAFDGAPFAQHADPMMMIGRLGRSAGTYDLAGEVLMAPGAPMLKIHGKDTVRTLWQGAVVHMHSDGGAEGTPGEYHSDLVWGFDSLRKSLRGVYVSNTGAVGVMDGEFADDGSFVATTAGRQQGKPMAQRMIMQFDAKGAIVRGSGHTLLGTAAPIESYRGTYTRQ